MINYNAASPDQLDRGDWLKLQGIQRDAFSGSLDRSQAEVDSLVDWNDPDRYILSHVDPNSEVGKRFNGNQEYSDPRIVIAREEEGSNKEPIGFAYGAYNVSGSSSLIRAMKKINIAKNYFWIREVAVRPDHQRKHIALHMAQTLLESLDVKTPVTAYSWPDELDYIEAPLFLSGFKKTDERQVSPFGKEYKPTRQVRYQGLVGDALYGLALLDKK